MTKRTKQVNTKYTNQPSNKVKNLRFTKNMMTIIPLSMASVLLLSGCWGKEEPKKELKKITAVEPTDQEVTVAQLKEKYKDAKTNYVMPLYNVSNDKEFVFNFNSYLGNINTSDIISVYTDSKCDPDSRLDVDVSFDSYEVGPSTIRLKPKKGTIAGLDDTWGNALTYYIKINYDLDSPEPSLLKESVIIPFTIKSKTSVPTLEYKLADDGTFSLKWDKIKGATKYTIYSLSGSQTSEFVESGKSYSELAFENAYPVSLGTVKAGKPLSFKTWSGSKPTVEKDYADKIIAMNKGVEGDYFVTATVNGKESLASNLVSIQEVASQIPFKWAESFNGETFENVRAIPRTVNITMLDGTKSKVIVRYNTKKVKVKEGKETKISFSIQGTRFTGTIKVTRMTKDDLDALELSNSQTSMSSDYAYKNKTSYSPSKSLPAVQTELVDKVLQSSNEEPKEDKQTKEKEQEQADSKSKITNYEDKTALAITSTVVNGDGSKTVTYSDGSTQTTTKNGEIKTTKPTLTPQQQLENLKGAGVIAQQRFVTKQEVDWGNDDIITRPAYLEKYGVNINASSSLEEYLALNLLNHVEKISMIAYPKAQEYNLLSDTVNKVLYQNPLILGVKSWSYDYKDRYIKIDYNYSKEDSEAKRLQLLDRASLIVNKLNLKNLDAYTKAKAIYDYFQNNAVWGLKQDGVANIVDASTLTEARQEQEKTTLSKSKKNKEKADYDAYTAYGVLVEKVGVDIGYAQAYHLLSDMSGLPSIVVTGLADGKKHYWNKVRINNTWYNVDPSSTKVNVSIPYMLVLSDSSTVRQQNFLETNDYALESEINNFRNDNDKSLDMYVANALEINQVNDISDRIIAGLQNDKDVYLRLQDGVDTKDVYSLTTSLVQQYASNKLVNARLIFRGNYVLFTTTPLITEILDKKEQSAEGKNAIKTGEKEDKNKATKKEQDK